MNTLIIYDNAGYVISVSSGTPAPREPIDVPFLWVDIPSTKRLKITNGIGVDTTVTPHQAILEDIPPTEVESLEKQVADLQYTLMMNGVI